MMGDRVTAQEALFYSFSLERHVPVDHMLRSIDRFVHLSAIREHLKPFYSEMVAVYNPGRARGRVTSDSDLAGVDRRSGAVMFRKELRQDQVLTFFSTLPRCVVAMEACASAHCWARKTAAVGHDVEADEDEARWDERLTKVARRKPAPEKPN